MGESGPVHFSSIKDICVSTKVALSEKSRIVSMSSLQEGREKSKIS